jgi:hypothetical protein
MKIYRFRKLTNEDDYCRLRKIIETGEFWCSYFWELNDPLEGVFTAKINKLWEEQIKTVTNAKFKYRICSFTDIYGSKKPMMWGYYTEGFKGVAIEVLIPDQYIVRKVSYGTIPDYEGDSNNEERVKNILSTKIKSWEHEREYRYLDSSDGEFHEIGKITAIYFGTPYKGLANSDDIRKQNELFDRYENYKVNIIKKAKECKIKCFDVNVIGNSVIKSKTEL